MGSHRIERQDCRTDTAHSTARRSGAGTALVGGHSGVPWAVSSTAGDLGLCRSYVKRRWKQWRLPAPQTAKQLSAAGTPYLCTPSGDLALRHAVQRLYELDQLPTAHEMDEVAERWRPHRSLAVSWRPVAGLPFWSTRTGSPSTVLRSRQVRTAGTAGIGSLGSALHGRLDRFDDRDDVYRRASLPAVGSARRRSSSN